jgi:hypothetical protein
VKLERLHEYIIPAVATLTGMGIAVYSGRLSGAGQMGTLALLLFSVLLMVLVLHIKERVWILVPLLWGFTGRISLLTLPFSVSNLAVFFIFGVFLVFQALGVYRRKIQLGGLDLLMFANVVYLASVYIRNPVGTLAFGSARVGGRPYFEIGVAILAYLVLARVILGKAESRTIPALMISGSLIQGIIAAATYYIPALVPIIAPIYSGVAADISETTGANSITDERQTYLGAVATPSILGLLSFYRPITLLNPLNPGRFVLFIASIALVLLSGFRSIVFLSAVYFALSSYLRTGFRDIFKIFVIGIPALVLLLALQGRVLELPFSAQRALSFLPGKWSDQAKADAASSTQWRVEMWKEMLATDKYIKSRWFGDGFGFSQRELQILMRHKLYGPTSSQEEALLVGGVHSGPVSTIRYVGFVGLALYLSLLVGMCVSAWKLIHRARNTVFFSAALFVGMPIVYSPFEFVVVYGSFDSAFATSIFSLGLLKLMNNTLTGPVGTSPAAIEQSKGQRRAGIESVRAEPVAGS